MAIETTNRFALPQWTAGTDPYPGRIGWKDILKLLDDRAAMVFPSGTSANRPRSGTFGRFYLATDQGSGGVLYYDGGAGWVALNLIGGGGHGATIAIGRTPVNTDEGSAPQAARADHVHTLPLATATNHGALSSQHYDLLDKAAVTATPQTLVRRTTSGNIVVPEVPAGENDAAGKKYVRDLVGTHLLEPWQLVRRWSSGTFHVPDPIAPMDVSNKRFVESRASRAAWKENWRPMPYGLPEVLSIDTGLYDYRDEEGTPEAVRGKKDVLGSTVENVAEAMPLLAVDGEDGEPERINDRDLIWVLLRAVQELTEEVEDLRTWVRARR